MYEIIKIHVHAGEIIVLVSKRMYNQKIRLLNFFFNLAAVPVTVSSQIDLPPTYSDIGNYAKVENDQPGASPPAYDTSQVQNIPTSPPPAYHNPAYNNS